MKAFFLVMAAGAALLVPNTASASTTLDFEVPDTGRFAPIGPSYGGLTFTNWAVIDGPGYGPSGYANVITSGQQSACGCAADYGQTFTSISSGSAFDLLGGNFASAWNNGASLLVQGYLGSTLLYSQNYLLNTTGPSALVFGFTGIDLVNFSISGGTPSGLSGGGNYFAVDDLRINAVSAVPEPATWAMMLLGFGFVGGAMRSARRKQKMTASYA